MDNHGTEAKSHQRNATLSWIPLEYHESKSGGTSSSVESPFLYSTSFYDYPCDVSSSYSFICPKGCSPSDSMDCVSNCGPFLNTYVKSDGVYDVQLQNMNTYKVNDSISFNNLRSNKEKYFNTFPTEQLKRSFDACEMSVIYSNPNTSVKRRKWASRIAKGIYIENLLNKAESLSKFHKSVRNEQKTGNCFEDPNVPDSLEMMNICSRDPLVRNHPGVKRKCDTPVEYNKSCTSSKRQEFQSRTAKDLDINDLQKKDEYLKTSGKSKSFELVNVGSNISLKENYPGDEPLIMPLGKTHKHNDSSHKSIMEKEDTEYIITNNKTAENVSNEESSIRSIITSTRKLLDDFEDLTSKNISNRTSEKCEIAFTVTDILNNLSKNISNKALEKHEVESLVTAIRNKLSETILNRRPENTEVNVLVTDILSKLSGDISNEAWTISKNQTSDDLSLSAEKASDNFSKICVFFIIKPWDFNNSFHQTGKNAIRKFSGMNEMNKEYITHDINHVSEEKSNSSGRLITVNISDRIAEESEIESLVTDILDRLPKDISCETLKISEIQTPNNFALPAKRASDNLSEIRAIKSRVFNNDFNQVCENGSRKFSEMMETEEYVSQNFMPEQTPNNFENLTTGNISNKTPEEREIESLITDILKKLSKDISGEMVKISEIQTPNNFDFPVEKPSNNSLETHRLKCVPYNVYNEIGKNASNLFSEISGNEEYIPQNFNYEAGETFPYGTSNSYYKNPIAEHNIQELSENMLIDSVHKVNCSCSHDETLEKREQHSDLKETVQTPILSASTQQCLKISDNQDLMPSESKSDFLITDRAVNPCTVYCSCCKKRLYEANANESVNNAGINSNGEYKQLTELDLRTNINILTQLFEIDSIISRHILLGISSSGENGMTRMEIINFLQKNDITKTSKLLQDVKMFLSAATDAHIINLKGSRYYLIEGSSTQQRNIGRKRKLSSQIENSEKLLLTDMNGSIEQSKILLKKSKKEKPQTTNILQKLSSTKSSVTRVKTMRSAMQVKEVRHTQNVSQTESSGKTVKSRSAIQISGVKHKQKISKIKSPPKNIRNNSAVQMNKLKDPQKINRNENSVKSARNRLTEQISKVKHEQKINKNENFTKCVRSRSTVQMSAKNHTQKVSKAERSSVSTVSRPGTKRSDLTEQRCPKQLRDESIRGHQNKEWNFSSSQRIIILRSGKVLKV